MEAQTTNLKERHQNLSQSPSFEPNPQTPATDSTGLSDQSSFENYMIDDLPTQLRLPKPNGINSFNSSYDQLNIQDFGDSYSKWPFDPRHIKLVTYNEPYRVLELQIVGENQWKYQLQPYGLSLQQDERQYQQFFWQQQDQSENLDYLETPQCQQIVQNNVASSPQPKVSNQSSQGLHMRQDSAVEKVCLKNDDAYSYIEPPPQAKELKDKKQLIQVIQTQLENNITYVCKCEKDEELFWEQFYSDQLQQQPFVPRNPPFHILADSNQE